MDSTYKIIYYNDDDEVETSKCKCCLIKYLINIFFRK